jgi:S-phase kinase-associated protein 1
MAAASAAAAAELRVLTADGQELSVPECVVTQCKTVSDLRAQFPEGEVGAIPLELEASVLEKVVAFCRHREESPLSEHDKAALLKPPRRDDEPWPIPEWENDFVCQGAEEAQLDFLYAMAVAANYLNNKDLLFLATKVIANKVRGKSGQDIVRILGVDEEYTPEKEKEVRDEFPWIEDRIELSYDD